MESKSVIDQRFDRSGRYESGLNSLVKSLKWAFRLLLVAIIAMIIYFFTWGGYFSVEPQQAVIVMRFGEIQETVTSGGRWFMPYPVNQFIRVQTNPQFLNIDFLAAPTVGTEPPASFEPGRDAYLLTGDANIVHTSWRISYKVSNPAKYYTTLATPLKPVENGLVVNDVRENDVNGFPGTRGPQTLLRNLFRQAVIQVTAGKKVDDILTSGQAEYNNEVEQRFTALVAAADCGIAIDSVTLGQISPPGATKAAFEQVTAAGNTRSKLRNEAEAYRVEVENDSNAKRVEIIAAAETYKTQVVASVKAESRYFSDILKEYRANPETVLMALYTSVLSEAMQSSAEDKFILGTTGTTKKQVRFLLNPEPKKTVITTPAGGEEK